MNKSQTYDLKGIRVLIVDDNPYQASYIQDLLEDVQAECVTATSSQEAFDILIKSVDNGVIFNCVILDTQMPNMNGYELAQTIRNNQSSELRTLPIIGLLKHNQGDEREKGFASGMSGMLMKPIIPPELYHEIQNLQQSSFVGMHSELKKLHGKRAYIITSDSAMYSTLCTFLGKQEVSLDHFESFNALMKVVEHIKRYDFAFIDWNESTQGEENIAQKLELYGQNTFKHMLAVTADWSQIESAALGLGIAAYIGVPLKELEILNVLQKVLIDDELASAQSPQGNEDFPNTHILVADDNMTNAMVLQNALETFGATVDVVYNGTDAQRMLVESSLNSYSLVFLDIFMPDIQGLKVTETFRKLDRPDSMTLPIIGISGNSSIDLVEKAISSGMNALMLKPINRKSLLSYMNLFLKEENYSRIFAARMSSQYRIVQNDLMRAQYKADIVSYLANHHDSDEVIDYIASNLLSTAECDRVIFISSQTKRCKDWIAPNSEPCFHCQDCPLKRLDASCFDSEKHDLKIDDLSLHPNILASIHCHAQSLLAQQIILDGKEYGRLAIQFVHQKRKFTDAVRQILQIAADIIATALERERTNLIMKQQERENKLLLENTTIPMAMFDNAGFFVRCNQAYCDFTNLTQEQLHGMNASHGELLTLIGGTSKDLFPLFEVIHHQKHSFEATWQIRNRVWRVKARGAYDDNGKLLNVFQSAVDITDANRTIVRQAAMNACFESMLMRNYNVEQAMVEIIDIIVNYFHANIGYILQIDSSNNKMIRAYYSSTPNAQLLGARLDTLIGFDMSSWINALKEEPNQFHSHLKAENVPREWEAIWKQFGFGSMAVISLSLKNKIWGSFNLIFKDEDHQYSNDEWQMIMSFQSLMEMLILRNHLTENLKDERDRAIEAEKAKSLFFATVSHDIRTPLNAIIGLTELLKAGGLDDATQQKYMNSIIVSSNTLKLLIDDVLDLSKLEANKMQFNYAPCNIRELAETMLSVFLPQAMKKQLQLSTDFGYLPMVVIDSQRIRQILTNLLSNALKFTQKGGVTLRVDFRSQNALYGTLRLDVIDTGCGIAESERSHLMKPFAQVRGMHEGGGTGLGLAICKAMLSKMNGEFTFTSTAGKGSTFTALLHNVQFTAIPAKQQPEEKSATPAKSDKSPLQPQDNLKSLNILIVDDTQMNLLVLKAMLKRLGVGHIYESSSGKDALEKLKTTNVDAVLTDWWMPGMCGDELVKTIRNDTRLANLPVYVITADVDIQKTYAKDGFTGIFLKPIDISLMTTFLNDIGNHKAKA